MDIEDRPDPEEEEEDIEDRQDLEEDTRPEGKPEREAGNRTEEVAHRQEVVVGVAGNTRQQEAWDSPFSTFAVSVGPPSLVLARIDHPSCPSRSCAASAMDRNFILSKRSGRYPQLEKTPSLDR